MNRCPAALLAGRQTALESLRLSGAVFPFTTSDAEYDAITAYFVEPDEAEGLTIVRHASTESGQAGLL